jgi:hypothetical protein
MIANGAEILGETGRDLRHRRGRSTDRTIGPIGRNRQRGGNAPAGVDVAERENELAGQRKNRQPGNSTAVRSKPPHGSRPGDRRRKPTILVRFVKGGGRDAATASVSSAAASPTGTRRDRVQRALITAEFMATAAMCDTGCNTGAMCDCVRAGLDYTPLWYRSRPNTAIPLMCQAASFHIERRTSAWSA